MNDKFKEWADEIRGTAAYNGNEAMHEAADFLQSLADMPDEPDDQETTLDEVHIPSGDTIVTAMVTKSYADWHIKNGMKWQMQVNALEEKLAAKDARIKLMEKDASVGLIVWKHIDSMNDLCEPDFTADKVLKRFLDEVMPVIESALPMLKGNRQQSTKDQPKRPILADQPEVFNALLMALDCRYAKSTQTRPDIAREAMQCIRELLEGP